MIDGRTVTQTASITIDVDPLWQYERIHGLGVSSTAHDPILEVALPRFLALCARRGIAATLFVPTMVLEAPQIASCLRDAAHAGHELASHSHAHAFDLSQQAPAQIEADLFRSARALETLTGTAPRGFRAPGYNHSEALMDGLEKTGFAYDSSFFPSLPYFAARRVVQFWYAFNGRSSCSLAGVLGEFAVQRAPFFPQRGHRTRRARNAASRRTILEIPIGAARGLPWLGTTVALLPDVAGDALTRVALGQRAPLVFELHAIDFADAGDGYSPELLRAQPDLRVPLRDKLRRLEAACAALGNAREIVTLAEVNARVRATPSAT